MKKYICLVIILLSGLTASQAQRMLPNQKGLEVNAGVLSFDKLGSAYYLGIGMIMNGRNGNYGLWEMQYTHLYHTYKEITIPVETYTAEGGYSIFLLGDSRKNIALNLALTGIVGYERLNRGETVLYDGAKILSKENWIYGAGGQLRFETYLTNKFIISLQGRTRAIWGTDLELLRPSAGLGLRFNF
ncbi:MAG: conjugal transfer protein TraO [Bacteroidetes bacterium 43-16]|uniref:conjugal transfer protein TraO n=1 Tax=Bacteroidota TaxID=976 RepID=UPI00092680E2|nr:MULTISPECIES: conjugal transfer protein TraO [Bacteroidota]OJV51698.1 MAG: conjugal transfer protein TraO [Bacteroidetes bacterium 43-16]